MRIWVKYNQEILAPYFHNKKGVRFSNTFQNLQYYFLLMQILFLNYKSESIAMDIHYLNFFIIF